jgi:hypothetical protein
MFAKLIGHLAQMGQIVQPDHYKHIIFMRNIRFGKFTDPEAEMVQAVWNLPRNNQLE